MSTPIDGLPEDLAHAELGEGRVTLDVDASVYPLEALYGAAYVFIDRCYVLLDKPKAERFRAVLSPKKPSTDDAEGELRELAGAFANELLACAWRAQITQANRAQVEAVTMRAIAGAMGPPTLDDLEDFDFTDEAFEDPLGIAMSWEEKYAKPPEGEPAAEADAPEDAS